VHPRADNTRPLAAKVFDQVDNAILDLIEAGSGRLQVEVRSTSCEDHDVSITWGPTSSVTLPAVELGAEAKARLDRRRHQEDSEMRATPLPEVRVREPRRYLDTKEVARRYGITPAAVRQRNHRRQLPPPIRPGRSLLWEERELDRWDDGHRTGGPLPDGDGERPE